MAHTSMTQSLTQFVFSYFNMAMLCADLPQDKQVHFGHPIIESTCKSFYFDRWSDIATFDRETFKGSVPQPLVALVGTVVRQSLPLFLLRQAYSFLVSQCFGQMGKWNPVYSEARNQAIHQYVQCNSRQHQHC